MRLVCLSDTHCFHERIAVPDGDVLLYAGDFCSFGEEPEARSFAAHLLSLPHEHKVVIAGNHDRCIEADPSLAPRLFEGCHYLFDSAVTIAGIHIYGAPWQPWFLDWAFNLQRGKPLRDKWSLISEGTDVLITHGPPQGILDETLSGDHAGCEELLIAIARLRPRVHLFGHIHEGYGTQRDGDTLHVNASNCTAGYDPTNPAIVIDLPQRGSPKVLKP